MASPSQASTPLQIPPQWRYKRLYSFPYPVAAGVTSPVVSFPVELTKYMQTDYVSRMLIQVTGTIVVTDPGGGPAPGTATGNPNPEALLVTLRDDTTPQLNGVVPINQLSSRGLLVDNTFMRGYIRRATPIADTAGVKTVNILYEVYFKRPFARKGAEYDHAVAKYSSDLLTLNLGGRDQLFSGGGESWNLSGLQVSIFVDSDLNNDVNRIHNVELFENTYPITATQSDFPIDTLPKGFLYTDLVFVSSLNNVLSDAIINNISIEGGGRVWLPQGDNNASLIQVAAAEYRGIITDPSYDPTGIYPAALLRDGMLTNAIDALVSPLTIRLNVTFTGGSSNLVRLIGRKMVPGAPTASNPRLR